MKRFFLFFPITCLLANPSGMQAVSGTASTNQTGHTLTITNSDKAILHWEDFSIGKDETTRFVQPDARSSVLNRVTGSNISKIMGRLESNGSVVLINERGLIVGPDGVIDTAGFIGSTFDVLDESFLKGKELLFEGESDGHIVHMGHINARGGQIYLKAGKEAVLGEVNLYASVIRLEEGSEIKADSVTSDAGNIMVMSEEETRFYGHISAQSVEGRGGTAEVSSRGHLHVSGHADLRSQEGQDGRFILDPGSVDVVSGPNTAPPASMDTFNDGWINDQLTMGSLSIATTNSTNGGTETLTVDGAVAISWATPNGLTLIGRRNLIIDSGASISSTNSGGAAFTALDLQGNTTGATGSFSGIDIDSATLSTVSGDISMKGAGGGTSTGGVLLRGTTLVTSTGAGSVKVTGTNSSSGVSDCRGVQMQDTATIRFDTDSTGRLTVIGRAGGDGTGNSNQGIFLTSTAPVIESLSTSDSAGTIRLIGIGGAGTDDNAGIWIDNGASLSTVNGDIKLDGQGAGIGGQNYGVSFFTTSSLVSTGSGNLNVKGIGSNGVGGANIGVNVTDTAEITLGAASTGDLTVHGTGRGSGGSCLGVSLRSTCRVRSLSTASSPGRIRFVGTGAQESNLCRGVSVINGAELSSVDGNIELTGTGGGTTTLNEGIYANTVSSLGTTGSGNILFSGVSGADGSGVLIEGFAVLEASGTGNITLIGSGGAEGNQGVNISNGGSVLTSAGTGKITFDGTGGQSGSSNGGVRIASNVSSASGRIKITGRTTGTGTTGVNVSEGGVLSSTVTAPITVTAHSDIVLNGEAFINGGSGDVTINSSGNVLLTGGGLNEPAVIDPGTGDLTFNIGRNLILTAGSVSGSEVQIGARRASSSANITFNNVGGRVELTGSDLASYALIGHGDGSFTGVLGGNITFTNVGTDVLIRGAGTGAGSLGFAQIGHADFTASTLSGNIFINSNNTIRLFAGDGAASANVRIGNGGLGNALSFGSSTMQLIAGRNLQMISRIGEAQIQNFNGPLTLVVDNLFPSSPDFGTGSFVINSLLTATGALRIYTVSPDQNIINDQINGVNFITGPFDVDDPLQQFNTYFPAGTYEGTSYKFYYKVGGKTFQAIQIPAITALTVANAQLTDLLPVFRYMRLSNYPVYHGDFCEFKDKKRFECDPTLDPYGSFLFEDDVYWINSAR